MGHGPIEVDKGALYQNKQKGKRPNSLNGLKAHKNTDFKTGCSPHVHQLKVHLAKIICLKPLNYRQTFYGMTTL